MHFDWRSARQQFDAALCSPAPLTCPLRYLLSADDMASATTINNPFARDVISPGADCGPHVAGGSRLGSSDGRVVVEMPTLQLRRPTATGQLLPPATARPISPITGGFVSMADVDVMLADIGKDVDRYRKLVDEVEALQQRRRTAKAAASSVDAAVLHLASEREVVKRAYIARKQDVRRLLSMAQRGGGNDDVMGREKRLASLQESFREIDGDYKALNVHTQRNLLLFGTGGDTARRGGTAAAAAGGVSGSSSPGSDPRATNDGLLGAALAAQRGTTQQLKEGLATVEVTKSVAGATNAQLLEDREKMMKISEGLDEVDSELVISRRLITQFVKRLYTDKVVIAFATLLVLGIVGIIVYAAVKPDQTTFTVPDEVKPPTHP